MQTFTWSKVVGQGDVVEFSLQGSVALGNLFEMRNQTVISPFTHLPAQWSICHHVSYFVSYSNDMHSIYLFISSFTHKLFPY